MTTTRRRIAKLALSVVAVLAVRGSLYAQDARFLAREDIILYGIGLKVEPAQQTVPKDIATIVSTFLQAPTLPANVPPFAPDAEVRATLRGPSFATPQELVVRPNSPFTIPPLTVPGLHTLENIRLISGGEVLLHATPEYVTIDVIEKLLVTQITARALSADEIREKGIVFDKSDFQAYNFTAAFAIEDRKVQIDFPVVLPTLQGASQVNQSTASIPVIAPPAFQTLATVIPDTLKNLSLQIPNLSVGGFSLKVDDPKGQALIVPPIPGVIVIPGDIGFLNQFFSVMLMVGNVAPAGSNLVVTDLSAQIVLPSGNDGVVGSVDDPLTMARTAQGESPRARAIVQAGPDGKLGTPDDIVTLAPGETGNAEFLVEGRREGSHAIEMEITGTLVGLPIGPVTVRGRAVGAVLVRNPTFTLTFTHPDTVSAGEPYTLDITVTNTSTSPANFVSVNLFPQNVSGATIIGEATRQVDSIPPGDSATLTFDLVSRRSGKVTAATLDSNENVAGRFQLKTAVGELGVPVSPDSLVLPPQAGSLPKPLREAAIGLLGKAWAVATAPAAALPKDVRRFSKKIVLERAIEVAAAGVRVNIGEPVADAAAQLAMDFAGSDYGTLADRYPQPADLAFEQQNVEGFDALRRTSVRGDVFAQVVANLLAPDLASAGAVAFHQALASRWAYRPGHISVLVGSNAPTLPFRLSVIDPAGNRVGGIDERGKVTKQVPFSDVFTMNGSGGTIAGELAVLATPQSGDYVIRLERIDGATDEAAYSLTLVYPDANGNPHLVSFPSLNALIQPNVESLAGDLYHFAVQMFDRGAPMTLPTQVSAAGTPIAETPAAVMAAVQQLDADTIGCDNDMGFAIAMPAGRVIAVLFSAQVTPESAQDKFRAEDITHYSVEENKVVGVAVQPGGRIVYLALRDPLGPFVPRQLHVTGIVDRRARPLADATVPIQTTIGTAGAVVSGRVLGADGAPIAFADVRLFYEMECATAEGGSVTSIGISAKTADVNGRYGWDFVGRNVIDRIVAIDPMAEEFRDVRFNIARDGQRLNVDIVLLGRGTFAGVARAENGLPLKGTVIRVTSLTDRSMYGATTGDDGRFVIPRIPVGNIFVEAVNVAASAQVRLSEYIASAGAVTTRDLVLLTAAQQQIVIRTGTLTGHVLRQDGAIAGAGLPVIVYYRNASQPGVMCPGDPPPDECAIAADATDAAGAFTFANLTAGELHLETFDQTAYQQGDARVVLAPDGTQDVNVLLSGGFGTVRGVVLDAAGNPLAGASVGGGLSLVTTGATGEFVLTDVPAGHREIVAVSDALGSTGRAAVDVSANEEARATIVIEGRGRITGVVTDVAGTPVAGIQVYAFYRFMQNEQPLIRVIGTAVTADNGAYEISSVPLNTLYTISAFRSDFSDGNITTAILKYAGQSFKADIRFRGGNGGRVNGTVFDSDGNTPLKARVGISGEQLVLGGGRVAIGFKYVQNFRIADTDLSGAFSLAGLWPGTFAVQAVGSFSPDPITLEGEIPTPGATVQMNLRLQATSQIRGTVYQPDGVTPVGAGTVVTYRSNAFRTICAESASGLESCDVIPQGIQSENVVTDANGGFWLPLVNAGAFTLTVQGRDSNGQPTGHIAQLRGTARPGETAEISARLRGLGDLAVHVFGSDGTTPIPGARVEVTQLDYPDSSQDPDGSYTRRVLTTVADATGTALFSGGDALLEGALAVSAIDLRTGSAGRASATITADGQRRDGNVYVNDAVGAVYGVVYHPDGTPAAATQVVITGGDGPIAFTLTDAEGGYRQESVPLGTFTVEAFEASTARSGLATGTIYYANTEVPVNVYQTAPGLVKGTVLDAATLDPLKGWEVTLRASSASGRQVLQLVTTTTLDGTYSFPGVSQGTFTLAARKTGINGTAFARGALTSVNQAVDVPLLVTIVRTLAGSVRGTVFNPDGTPAANSAVVLTDSSGQALPAVANAAGEFQVDDVALGRFVVQASSQTTLNAGSAIGDLSFDGDVADVRVVMQGLSRISGVVEYTQGGAAANIEVTLRGDPSPGCPPHVVGGGDGEEPVMEASCTTYTDANGAFAFQNVPAKTFTVTATDPINQVNGMAGGTVAVGSNNAVRIVLAPTGRMTGRVLFSNGKPAAGIVGELVVGASHLFATTSSDGRFAFGAVPMSPYALTLQDPVGAGLATRTGQITGDLALGDVALDDAPPSVVETIPAPSAVGVHRDQPATITFSEPVDGATVNHDNISLVGPSGPVTSTLQLGSGDTVVTLAPVAPLAAESRYSIRVKGMKDRIGHLMVNEYVAGFTTEDITPPSAVQIDPPPAASGVSIETTVRIKFSEPIDPARFRGPPLTLTLGGAAVDGRIEYGFGNTVLIFTPARPLSEAASYRVQALAAYDLSGNAQAQGLDYLFTTFDRTPPIVLGLSAPNDGTVIENGITTVTANVGGAHDVAFVDFFINGTLASTDRTEPFAITLAAKPEFGGPGERIRVSAIATDTSGIRGIAAIDTYVTVIADQAPTIVLAADKSVAANGDLVTVIVHATDDLALARIAYKAQTGRVQDAASRAVSAGVLDRTETFSFNIPATAAPGSTIVVNATAADSKGQVRDAEPIAVTVLDSVVPTVTITGATTGAKVYPAQETRAVVTAQDLGGVRSLTFTVGGVVVRTDTRQIDPPQNSIVTTFTFSIPANARSTDQVTLDAFAIDQSGNRGTAARVILPVADTVAPAISLRTRTGSLHVVRGQAVEIIATATDDVGLSRIELSARGAATYTDARQVPPLGSAEETFTFTVPESAADDSTVLVEATTVDLSGNRSTPASLSLTVMAQVGVTLPPSIIVAAGETADVAMQLSAPAPAPGVRVELRSADTAIAAAVPFVDFATGELSKTFGVTGESSGTTTIAALVGGVERSSMTVAVQGGIVTGTVQDWQFQPVGGVQITVSGGGTVLSAVTDGDGHYAVSGAVGPSIGVQAQDPITRLRGYATGTMAHSNGHIEINVILVPAGSIGGSVFEPDGTTPVGAGTRVDIMSASDLNTPLSTTWTDEAGAYSFPLVSLGNYVLQATSADSLRKGRAAATITESGQELTVPISYLGHGVLRGTVRGGGSSLVPNATLRLWVTTIFGTTGPEQAFSSPTDGTFEFQVPVGRYSLEARDPFTGQGGSITGTITQHLQVITQDVNLSSYASLQGTVFRVDGATVVSGAIVTISNDNYWQQTTTGADGRYAFEVLPLGHYAVAATDPGTRGIARAVSTDLTAQGQQNTVNLTLLPQGTVVVTVNDASGNPVNAAWVSVTSSGGGTSDTVNGTTGAEGVAVLEHVLAGSISVYASWNNLQGSARGTLAPDETRYITVTLQPTGSIAGVVYAPNGQNPASAGKVWIAQHGDYYGGTWFTLAADGTYRADGLTLGSYDVRAYDDRDRLRAYNTSVVRLTAGGQVATCNLVFVGLGTVIGQVLNPDAQSTPAPNMWVSLWSLNTRFARSFGALTNAAGYYAIDGVPVGAFTVNTGDSERQLLGEGAGTVTRDGDEARVDIVLQNNAITLPVNRYDANAMSFPIQRDASIQEGRNAAYGPFGGRAFRLELVANGVTTQFTGSDIAANEDGGRELVARQQNVAGLNVTRKVYVPKFGYFVRYLEILTNTTTDPITVGLRVASTIGRSHTTATSSGDTAFDVSNPVQPDRWIVLDDNGYYAQSDTARAIAFVLDGPDAAERASAVSPTPQDGQLWCEWTNVTVPAGGTAMYLHFGVQQLTPEAAIASAERLVQLPPEALAGLSAEELAGVRNFVLPPGGESTLEGLPSLEGRITGRLFEFDGVTPVPYGQAFFKSSHILFGTTQRITADAGGNYTLESSFTDSWSVAVPVAPFTIYAWHPTTNVNSPAVAGSFGSDQTTAAQDLVFTNAGVLQGTVRTYQGAAVTSGNVSIYCAAPPLTVYLSIAADATYRISGLPPCTYAITASVPNAMGTGLIGSTSIVTIAGQTVQADIALEPTGAVTGRVRTGSNNPASNVAVSLTRDGFSRTTASDTSGLFTFADVPIGAFTISAAEPATGIPASVAVTVAQGQTTTAPDLMLASIGAVSGYVSSADGPVAGIAVILRSANPQYGGTHSVTTDGGGGYRFGAIPVGAFSLTVSDPERQLYGEASGRVDHDGEEVRIDIAVANNVVVLPVYWRDGNGFQFDIQANGSIQNGMNSVFNGAPAGTLAGAPVLSVVSGAAEQRFDGQAAGHVEGGGRELAIAQEAVAGVDVTRKIFVPQHGYFARYLEIVRNTGTEAVTIDLRSRSSLGYAYYQCWWGCWWAGYRPSLITTSSGDATLSASDPDNPDRWVMFDDNEGDPFSNGSDFPPAAFVFDGPGAIERAAVLSYATPEAGQLEYRWNNVTIPPGGTVAYLHFVVQQSTRAAAIASAERLVQLPPEALEGLSPEEIAAIRNFNIPSDGVGTLDPLPAVTGTVTGRVLDSDGVTPLWWRYVEFKSSSPYFARTYTVQTDDSGNFTIAAQFGLYSSVAVPLQPFTLRAQHTTGVWSQLVQGDFAPAATTTTQDIVFSNTGGVQGVVRRFTGELVTSGGLVIDGGSLSSRPMTSLTESGTYSFSGLPAGEYVVTASANHPQGSAVQGSATANVAEAAVTTADITLAATGGVRGFVWTAAGTAAASRFVEVFTAGLAWNTYTNDLGEFVFADIPVGTYTLRSNEPRTGIASEATVTVPQGDFVAQDLVLVALGNVQVDVSYGAGGPASNARVVLTESRRNSSWTVYADPIGRAYFSNIASGPFTVRAYHPVVTQLYTETTGTVVTEAQTVEVPMTVPITGTVTGQVFNPDGTTAPSAIQVTVTSANTAVSPYSVTTDGSGIYRVLNVPGGNFGSNILDFTRGVRGTATGTITADGQEVQADIHLTGGVARLPALLYDGNNFRWDIQSDGDMSDGSSDAYDSMFYLRVTANAAYRSFGSQSGALSEESGREIVITDPGFSSLGVEVTRKIYVPTTGYFARFLEIVRNTSTQPVSATIRVYGNLGSDSATSVYGSSSGDLAVDLSDNWFVTDDDTGNRPFPSSDPTLAFVLAGPGAAMRPTTLQRSTDNLTFEWSNIALAPGETVVIMHFGVQHSSHASAIAAAQRLVQLPPEALVGLDAAEIASIRNFAVPADGSSPLPPLVVPLFTGALSGTVLANDGVTPIAAAAVRFASVDPIFGKIATTTSSSTGAFQFTGVPVAPFTLQATHPQTSIVSPVAPSDFPAGQTTIVQNIVFSNTGSLRGVVRSIGGAPATAGTVTITGGSPVKTVNVPIAADGSYKANGLPPGVYTISVQAAGRQARIDAIAIGAGQSVDADAQLLASISISLHVVKSDGVTGIAGAQVCVQDAIRPSSTCIGTTDASGNFTIPSVNEGAFTISALDSSMSNAPIGTVSGSVAQSDDGQARTLTIVGGAYGNLSGMLYAGDGVTPLTTSTLVEFVDASSGAVLSSGQWAGGSYSFQGMTPANGAFIVRAHSPFDGTIVEQQDQFTASQESRSIDLVLPVSVVTGVVESARGTRVAYPNVFVTQQDEMGAVTTYYAVSSDSNGEYLVFGPRSGNFTVTAQESATALRGRSAGTLGPSEFATTLNVTLEAGGAVITTVRHVDETPVAGVSVNMLIASNGLQRQATTDALGVCRFDDVPAGAFTLSAIDVVNSVGGSIARAVTRDGEIVAVDLRLTDAQAPLAYTLHDVQNFLFDVQGNGSLAEGSGDAYDGMFNLEVSANGTVRAFSYQTGAAIEEEGRELVIVDPGYSSLGLAVTRKIYVPSTGSFGRYLELVRNTGTQPVTIGVRVFGNLGSDSATRVVASWSGDAVVDATDRWFVTDDDAGGSPYPSSDPTLAFVIQGENASTAIGAATQNSDQISYAWQNVVVAPGQTAAFMHFALQRASQSDITTNAQALTTLPPDAIVGLTSDEAAAIRNFIVQVAPGPTGGIGGTVRLPDGTAASSGSVTIAGGTPPRTVAIAISPDGSYTAADLPPGSYTVTAAASSRRGRVSDVLVVAGQTSVADVQLRATAAVQLNAVKAGGASPLVGARIYLQDTVEQPAAFVGITDHTGALSIAGVSEGPYTLRAFLGDTLVGVAGGAVAAADDGALLTASIVGRFYGDVRGTLFAADSETPFPSNTFVEIIDVSDGSVLASGNWSGTYMFSTVAPTAGAFIVRAHSPIDSSIVDQQGSFASAGETVQIDLTLPVSVIRGTVRFAGLQPVPYPNVFVTRQDEQGVTVAYYARRVGADGTYTVLAVPAGGFVVTAQDTESGLRGTATSTLSTSASVADVDVTLDAAGAVTGTIFDSAGSALPGASVTLWNSTGELTRATTSDAQGQYAFATVVPSDVEITACIGGGETPRACNASFAMVHAGETSTADVHLRQTGTINGYVFAADGVTPQVDTGVTVEDVDFPGSSFYYGYTDGTGAYSIGGIAAALVQATASTSPAGTAHARITAGNATTVNVTSGSGTQLRAYLYGIDGSRYDISYGGEIRRGGWSDGESSSGYPYYYAYALTVGGAMFPSRSFAATEDGGRELQLGPARVHGLYVSRKVYVPEAGGFARYLEVLSNPLPYPVTRTIVIGGELNSNRLVVSPSQTGNTYAVTDDPEEYLPALGHVFGGAGSPGRPAVTLSNGGYEFSYRWTVTVPAGGTAILMHFALQRAPTDVAGARDAAQQIASLATPEALAGMSAAERAQVVNFVIPQQ